MSGTDGPGEPRDGTRSPPADLLSRHPETAYFWGRAIGDGSVSADAVRIRARDETAARRLSAIAGGARVDHRIRERSFAHDTAVTRVEDEYLVQVIAPALGERVSAAFGLPIDDDPGGYRLDALAAHDRQLLRGLLEGCGTVCFKESTGGLGVSFVHELRLLRKVRGLLDARPVSIETTEPAAASGDRYWFSVADADAPAFAEWVYEGSEESGLFAPSRRRKLRRSVERATADREGDPAAEARR
ncbi:cobalamin biosynthesis protein [Halegenticoccus tardaugens]|uniref:cobalamin biosynthesis protein n=1 Tax=Halegenticoccus tardaugens TaxID=2071624 RepID=UPI00100BF4FC|nr:cobalamin biosynthesis protein [Halegenticoccus tardaugens]